MKDKIGRLARGTVEDSLPQMEFPQKTIEESILGHSTYQGELSWRTANKVPVRGLVYSGNVCVTLKQQYFSGESARIPYEVDTKNLEIGESVQGEFEIVCTAGEFCIPYRFTVTAAGSSDRFGLDTPEKFAQLALSDPDGAMRLFESKEFYRLPFMHDMPTRAIYDAMRRGQGRWNCLEEFLVGTGAKKRTVFSLSESGKHHVYDISPISETITVTRSQRCFGALRISPGADFIRLDRTVLTDAEFVGNEAKLSYRIIPDRLHGGKNSGAIRITGTGCDLSVEITVIKKEAAQTRSHRKENLRFCGHLSMFLRSYLNYFAGVGEKRVLLGIMRREWNAMADISLPDIQRRLWRAELSILAKRPDEAVVQLDELADDIGKVRTRNADVYCYYIYLRMCADSRWETKENFLGTVDKYISDGHNTPVLTVLRLRVTDDILSAPQEAMALIDELYRAGYRDPFVYLEGCRIFNAAPEMLSELDVFEMHILSFAVRHGYAARELAMRIASLASEIQQPTPMHLHLLVNLYDRWPEDEVLAAICGMLIRSDKREPEYFEWFVLGVEKDIRLTRLYEYYMYTMPEGFKGEIPAKILLYFSYNASLDVTTRARLYAYIIDKCNRESKLYAAFEQQMQEFALEQIVAGRVDRNLAKIYKRVLFAQLIDEKLAKALPDILQTRMISVRQKGIRTVVVVYGELNTEFEFPVKNGVAAVPMYSDNCRLLFKDANNARYCSIGHISGPLFEKSVSNRLMNACFAKWPTHPMMHLAICNSVLRAKKLTQKSVAILKEQLDAPGLSALYRSRIVSAMIRYFSQGECFSGEELLACVGMGQVSPKESAYLTEALINNGYISEAYDQARAIGYRRIGASELMKLANGMVVSYERENIGGREDAYLTETGVYLFRKGFYDDRVLSYLCRHFNGLSEEMLQILRKAAERNVFRGDLAERLLGQMLFVNRHDAIDEVFAKYISDGPANETLVKAYFVTKSYYYFVDGCDIPEEVIIHIKDRIGAEYPYGSAPPIMRLAILKYFASMVELDADDAKLCRSLVWDFYSRGIVFPFFKALGRHVRIPDEIRDKTIVEYMGHVGTAPEIKVRILPDDRDKPSNDMKLDHTIYGIYTKAIFLYEGESAEYEIWDNTPGGCMLVEKGVIEASVSGGAHNRAAMLNSLSAGVGSPQDEAWQRQAEDYAIKDTLVSKLFGNTR